MIDVIILAAACIVLLSAACWAWSDVLEREAMDAQLEADKASDPVVQKDKSWYAAFEDRNGRCWNCTEPHRVLELVDVGARYELTCPTCSELLKVRRGRKEAA